MRDIWISSDPHFLHKNILTFADSENKLIRPEFSCIEEMNETIIERHNSVVKEGDIWYCCGDVFFGSKEEFKVLWKRLNGRKRLVCGNHDDIKFLATGNFFQKIQLWRCFKEFGLILSHIPLHESSLKKGDFTAKNVHGHTHNNGSPEGPYQCVCMEQINYTPVNIEELRIR